MSKSQKKGGFTIIETMIAISLFLVVVIIGMNSLLSANVAHQKSADMRSILDNMNFIMEDMAKNLRTGFNYYCITGNDNLLNVAVPKSGESCWGIAFEPATSALDDSDPNNQWVYYINGGIIYKSTRGPYDVASNFFPLNPAEIVLSSTPAISGFAVLGAEHPAGNTQQPLATIRLAGTITIQNKNITTSFALQTSVSQRLPDVSP